jgi:hypothetical protein
MMDWTRRITSTSMRYVFLLSARNMLTVQSILTHLPQNTDFSKVRLFVLIYAPGLKEHPLDAGTRPPGSLSSSFSNIGHEQAQEPTEEKTL